jgi:hypothetical protein
VDDSIAVPKPKPAIPKTIGILNVVFGGLMLLCIPCMAAYIVALANMDTIVNEPIKQAEARQSAQRKQQFADLARREGEATTEEAKAAIRAQRKSLEAHRPPQVETVPMSNFMFKSFSNPRMIAYMSADWGTGLILNLLMLVAGIGLIRLRGWGRTLALGVAGIKIGRLALLTIALIIFVIPAQSKDTEAGLVQILKESPPPGPQTQPIEAMAADSARKMATMQTVMGIGMLVLYSIYPALTLWLLNQPGAVAACRPTRPAPGDDPWATRA